VHAAYIPYSKKCFSLFSLITLLQVRLGPGIATCSAICKQQGTTATTTNQFIVVGSSTGTLYTVALLPKSGRNSAPAGARVSNFVLGCEELEEDEGEEEEEEEKEGEEENCSISDDSD